MNRLIHKILSGFEVDGKKIPVGFIRYRGEETTYITYQSIGQESTLNADNEVVGYVESVDIDVFSKGNYFAIIKKLKKVLKENGFMYRPEASSGDLFETDTGYYHRTLNFTIEQTESEE